MPYAAPPAQTAQTDFIQKLLIINPFLRNLHDFFKAQMLKILRVAGNDPLHVVIQHGRRQIHIEWVDGLRRLAEQPQAPLKG